MNTAWRTWTHWLIYSRSPPPACKQGQASTPVPGSLDPQAQARTLSSTQVSLTCATCHPTAWTTTGWTPLTGFSLDTCQNKHVLTIGDISGIAYNYDMEKLRTVQKNKPSIWKFKPQDTFDNSRKTLLKIQNFSVFKPPQFSRIATLADFSSIALLYYYW